MNITNAGTGLWSDTHIWPNGTLPAPDDSVTIEAGTIVTIGVGWPVTVGQTGSITVELDAGLVVEGTLQNEGMVTLNSQITIMPGGSVYNSKTMVGPGFIDNRGTLVNEAAGSLLDQPGGVDNFVNETGASFANSGVLNVLGGFVNYGTMTNRGQVYLPSSGDINNAGTLENTGTIFLDGIGSVSITGGANLMIFGSFSSSGTFTQGPSSTIVIGSGTQVTVGEGDFTVPAGAALVVDGGGTLTVQRGAVLSNYGTVDNGPGSEFTVVVGGRLGKPVRKVLPGGSIVNAGGGIQNYGTVNNGQPTPDVGTIPVFLQPTINNTNGSIENEAGGTFFNYGSINNANGSISNNGTFHRATGTISGAGQITGNPLVQ